MSKRWKKSIFLLAVIGMMVFFTGCTLAQKDAGEEKGEPDCLIGAFITTEYVQESFLFSLDESGRLYVTVDKNESEEPLDWDIHFGDIEGICFFNATWQEEGQQPFTMITCGDDICDLNQRMDVTDEGTVTGLSGTLNAVIGEGDGVIFYVNPVYQTTNGDIYAVAGTGNHISGTEGISFTSKYEEKRTITENGEKKTEECKVELTLKSVPSFPKEIRFQYMNDALEILHTDVYVAGDVPEELTIAEGTACIVVETEWEDGSVTRELCNPEPETSMVETFVKVSEITVGKKSTIVNWK